MNKLLAAALAISLTITLILAGSQDVSNRHDTGRPSNQSVSVHVTNTNSCPSNGTPTVWGNG